eukprot:CAMPEP_0198730614 /NCGR_PEP_ID=MMETSP1475-20131203/25301_1 /TAXON_ID= ORGANISM="Unidentified sp., Strain CCMP1999" /NCGR_SAMPLE_ID=MMETSP1475 /ASSEMBLY_ACC=CAM_ASM_001111 /LENGTH=291 /DNA_ID=CAMNT_0044493441 /DNA_START=1 /DNA_END=873 /DNA_ORIENTATION=+
MDSNNLCSAKSELNRLRAEQLGTGNVVFDQNKLLDRLIAEKTPEGKTIWLNELLRCLSSKDHVRKLLLDLAQRSQLPYNLETLCNAIVASGDEAAVRQTFRELGNPLAAASDVRTRAATMKMYVANGDGDKALRLFSSAVKEGFSPTLYMHEERIGILVSQAKAADALEASQDAFLSGVRIREQVFTQILSLLRENGDLSGAVALLENMQRQKVAIPTATYNIILEMHMEQRDFEGCVLTYELMRCKGILGDKLSVSLVAKAHNAKGSKQAAERALSEARRESILSETDYG